MAGLGGDIIKTAEQNYVAAVFGISKAAWA